LPYTAHSNQDLSGFVGSNNEEDVYTLPEFKNQFLQWDSGAAYSILNFNISTTPVAIRFGICLPASCSQESMYGLGEKFSNGLTNAIDAIL
jgi:hypothetical protein